MLQTPLRTKLLIRRVGSPLMEKFRKWGTKITDIDEVRVRWSLSPKPRDKAVYIAFNKPIGDCCALRHYQGRKDNIIDFINLSSRNIPYLADLDKPR